MVKLHLNKDIIVIEVQKMVKGLEKEYYKRSSEDFFRMLERIRNHPDTVYFFKESSKPFFFLRDQETSSLFLELHKEQWEFDHVLEGFSAFGKKQIIESMMIHEIEATNQIENIRVDQQDLFKRIRNKEQESNSFADSYSALLTGTIMPPSSLEEVRQIYDRLVKETLKPEDIPDGKYFRKEPVYISDGLKTIHHGFYPEEAVDQGMTEFLELYNKEDTDLYERLLLSHFLIETVHPFYDGNGRLGRFLFTLKMFAETGSYLSFAVSSALNQEKKAYYRAFEEARHEHMFGSLNSFVMETGSILSEYNKELILDLKEKQERIRGIGFEDGFYTKSEKEILRLIAEGGLLSDFGVSNEEIMENTSVSKRTVIAAMQKFREKELLEETKIGRTVYHRLKDFR